jgi:hypothetical protein
MLLIQDSERAVRVKDDRVGRWSGWLAVMLALPVLAVLRMQLPRTALGA